MSIVGGSYTLNDGVLYAQSNQIGWWYGGGGVFTQNGGSAIYSGYGLSIGSVGGPGSSYNLNGGSLSDQYETVQGDGVFTQTGGSHVARLGLNLLSLQPHRRLITDQ